MLKNTYIFSIKFLTNMPNTDWDKFLIESEKELHRLRQMEDNLLPRDPVNWADVQAFLDSLEKDWIAHLTFYSKK